MNIFTHTKPTILDNSRTVFWLSIVLSLSALLMLSSALLVFRQDRRQFHQSATVQTPFKLNQEIRMGSALITAANPTYSKGSPHFKAPQGKHYLLVAITIKNFTERPIVVSPSTDIYLKDTIGTTTYLSPYELTNPFHAGELPAGEQTTGQLSYLVSDTANPNMYIDAIWSGGVLPISLALK